MEASGIDEAIGDCEKRSRIGIVPELLEEEAARHALDEGPLPRAFGVNARAEADGCTAFERGGRDVAADLQELVVPASEDDAEVVGRFRRQTLGVDQPELLPFAWCVTSAGQFEDVPGVSVAVDEHRLSSIQPTRSLACVPDGHVRCTVPRRACRGSPMLGGM